MVAGVCVPICPTHPPLFNQLSQATLWNTNLRLLQHKNRRQQGTFRRIKTVCLSANLSQKVRTNWFPDNVSSQDRIDNVLLEGWSLATATALSVSK